MIEDLHNWDNRTTHLTDLLSAITMFGKGRPMAALKHPFSGATPIDVNIGASEPSIIGEDLRVRGLRYSSPWTWIFASMISLGMWTSLAWLVWIKL
jgi:hypothetical protein